MPNSNQNSEASPAPNDWMANFPPAPDRVVRFVDGSYYHWPQLRWSFSNIQQLVPTKSVWKGAGAAQALENGDLLELDDARITTTEGAVLAWEDALSETCTDGIAVLHEGQLVYERYFGACSQLKPHILQSANKSFVGLVAECLIEDGKLQADAAVTDLIPELTDSAWGNATVAQVMDMQINMAFHEDYADPDSQIWAFLRAMGMAPPRPGEIPDPISDVLPRIPSAGEHGKDFAYREPNIFVLGWLVRRAANQDLASLVSEKIWQNIGAERDACYMLDGVGSETTCCTTLRDLLRFGSLMAKRGRIHDQQLIPAAAIERIFAGGDQAAFARANMPTLKNWSYRSQWWIRHLPDRICPVARGAHGQLLYIDSEKDLVVARFGSSKQPASSLLDPVIWPMIDLITERTAGS